MIKCNYCFSHFIPELLSKTVYAEREDATEEGIWFRIDIDEVWTAECPFCLGTVPLSYNKNYEEEDGYVILVA